MTKPIIGVNAFDADQSYTDVPEEIVGWSVFVTTGDEERDFIDEADVETEAEAERMAQVFAAKYNTDDIRHY